MNNFTFKNPTKLIFGKGMISKLSEEIPAGKKVLLTFGGGSVKANGVYQQVIDALKGRDCVEFWGIEPNPFVETIRKAVELGKNENVDIVLAVGGGSVLDATKLIAAAIKSESDPWDMVKERYYTGETLPVASVLTLPATGSEMNSGSVISNKETGEKFAIYTYHPVFSILDPETTFSLPIHQIACGLTDTFVHVMEQYLTDTEVSPLMDRWAEGILLTVTEIAPKVLANPQDYDQMANFMLSATMGLNGFISMGVPQDWATHLIGHELTALTGLTHGHTLAIVMPQLISVMREQKKAKILQYAQRVWGITEGSEQEIINAAVMATENFFRSLGLKTRLAENNVSDDVISEIVKRMKDRGSMLGEKMNIDYTIVQEILNKAK